jgi:hypothetical protein
VLRPKSVPAGRGLASEAAVSGFTDG